MHVSETLDFRTLLINDEVMGHWEMVVYVEFSGDLFGKLVRALISMNALCAETWPRCVRIGGILTLIGH